MCWFIEAASTDSTASAEAAGERPPARDQPTPRRGTHPVAPARAPGRKTPTDPGTLAISCSVSGMTDTSVLQVAQKSKSTGCATPFGTLFATLPAII